MNVVMIRQQLDPIYVGIRRLITKNKYQKIDLNYSLSVDVLSYKVFSISLIGLE